jgi:hypothetical protein
MTVATIEDPVHAVLAEARRWLSVREEPRGSNRGVAIDFFNYQSLQDWRDFPMGVKGAPWCAAFVSTIGRLALGHAWPVKTTVSCESMANWAESEGLLHRYPDPPDEGDLFLLYYQSRRKFGHVGLVTGIGGETILTLEGNTNLGGSREGYGVFERTRTIGETTAFVRWIDAL